MKKRPPNPVPVAVIIGALGAIALAALLVWFFAISPADSRVLDDQPTVAGSPAGNN